jgi:hypothetical protein
MEANMKPVAHYAVTVRGMAKGEAYRKNNRWHWVRPHKAGVETYGRADKAIDVREHIARACGAQPMDVDLTRKDT